LAYPVISSPASLKEVLLRQPVWRGSTLVQSVLQAVPTGFAMLDHELPGGGWPGGALAEILYAHEGIGELQLVLPALAALSAAGHRIAWIAPPHLPYAPALAAAGLNPSSLTVVHVPSRLDALWAVEQSLRAGTCKAVLVWLRGARYADLRRLALAAASNQGIGIVFRPAEESAQPSPACLRLALAADAGRVSARILKRRGAPAAIPLRIPIGRPIHAVDGASFPAPVARSPVARPCIA
jgi:hypothetical protein